MTLSTARGNGAGARFVVLDGLRGVAAFAVILDHVPGGWLGDLLPGRYLAVDFFFVLSGFVLAHAYGARLEGGWSPLAFMKARLVRLYPMYLMAFALGLALSVMGLLRGWVGPSWSDVLITAGFGVLFLPAPPLATFGGGALYPFNAPAWSLFFELAANFFFALIARFLSWRVLGVMLAAGAVAVAFTINRHAGVGGPGWLWAHADAGLARVMFDFFAGVAIYRLRGVRKIPALPWWGALIAFVTVIAVQTPPEWRTVYDIAAALVLMPVLVALASGAEVRGALAKACSLLGIISYGVYVIHVPLFSALGVAAGAVHVQLGEGPVLAMTVAIVAGVAAWLAYIGYDQPIRRWLSGGAKRAKSQRSQGEHG